MFEGPIELRIRDTGIISDNHSSNVAAFKILLNKLPCDAKQFIVFACTNYKTNIFFDSVHLVKIIRHNLLSAENFVFPGFDFEVGGKKTCTEVGYKCWHDIHKIYDKDKNYPLIKLSYQTLHPSDEKKNFNLALALFHATTIAACRCSFPQRHDMPYFLQLFSIWWPISNSNVKFDANLRGNAVTARDGIIDFLEKLSSYVDELRQSTNFCFNRHPMLL